MALGALLPQGRRDLSGIKPLSPALAGGFSPTLPPEDDILSEDLKEEEVRKEARWLSERLRQRAACTRASFML